MEPTKVTKWNPNKYPRSLLEAITMHAFLMRLGYRSDDVYFTISPESIVVSLICEDRQFDYDIGPLESSIGKTKWLWEQLVIDWNQEGLVTTQDAEDLWSRSKVKQLEQRIIHNLIVLGLTKGLDVPDPSLN